MRNRHSVSPDLADAVLEERVLAAYDPNLPPLVLGSSGYLAFSVPVGLSANLGTQFGGAIGGNGGSVGTSYFVTGFGISTIAIGNPIGFSYGPARGAASANVPTILVGSGANDTQGPRSVTRNTVAQRDVIAEALNLLHIRQQTSSGGYVPGQAASPATPGSTVSPPPPVPPAPPPAPAPVSQFPSPASNTQ